MDLFKILDTNPVVAFLFGGTMFVIFTKFINSKWLKNSPIHVRQLFEPFFVGMYLCYDKYKKKMRKHVRNYTIIYLIYASVPLLFLLLFPFITCAWKTGILVVGLWVFMIWGFLQFAKSKDNK